MCGIFGTFNGNPITNRMLALLNETRGHLSCGFLFGQFNDGQLKRIRITESVSKSILEGKIQDGLFDNQIFLGHTRAPSVGSVSKRNCHPFKVGNIIGAHNGTIGNWDFLKDQYKKEDPSVSGVDVDSEMLIWLISKKGIDSLSEARGSAAVWWVDLADENNVFFWIWNGSLAYSTEPYPAFSSDEDHLKVSGFKRIKIFENKGQIARLDLTDKKFYKVKDVKGKEYTQDTRGYNWGRGGRGGYSDVDSDEDIPFIMQASSVEVSQRANRLAESIKHLTSVKREQKLILTLLLGRIHYWCPKCEMLTPLEDTTFVSTETRKCDYCHNIVIDADKGKEAATLSDVKLVLRGALERKNLKEIIESQEGFPT